MTTPVTSVNPISLARWQAPKLTMEVNGEVSIALLNLLWKTHAAEFFPDAQQPHATATDTWYALRFAIVAVAVPRRATSLPHLLGTWAAMTVLADNRQQTSAGLMEWPTCSSGSETQKNTLYRWVSKANWVPSKVKVGPSPSLCRQDVSKVSMLLFRCVSEWTCFLSSWMISSYQRIKNRHPKQNK